MAETRRQCCRSGPTAPSRDAWRTIRYIAGLQSVDIIANQNADSERHFLMDRGNIPVVRFPELASCMMSESRASRTRAEWSIGTLQTSWRCASEERRWLPVGGEASGQGIDMCDEEHHIPCTIGRLYVEVTAQIVATAGTDLSDSK